MSGGRFDYKDMALKSEIFGYSDKPYNVFEDLEISELVWDTLDLIHEYDWYASGDTCKSDYLEAKADFKKKWLSKDAVPVRHGRREEHESANFDLYYTCSICNADNMCNYCPKHWAKMDLEGGE